MSATRPGLFFYAFFANLGVAVAKAVAAYFTGSSSAIAEVCHSVADCGNQLLLLVGFNRAGRAVDAEHPLGYGKASSFWSFMVAILLLSIGGLFSIYEGTHKLLHPEPMSHAWILLVVLLVSIALEGISLRGCLLEIKLARGGRAAERLLRLVAASLFDACMTLFNPGIDLT